MNIQYNLTQPACTFAAPELTAYLNRMGRPSLNYELMVCDLTEHGLPVVADSQLDDQFYIDVTKDHQHIYANNPRALLLAVYRYLTLIGCRFLRPGKQHEIVPTLTCVSDYYACEKHTASLRHRGACIEGADSIENLLEFIDWSPKIGFNSFFIQFKVPYLFMNRWYAHVNNPLLDPVQWTTEDTERIMPVLEEALAQRGLLHHAVGHGWVNEVLDPEAPGWQNGSTALTDDQRALIAQVNGVRGPFSGVATYTTNLCLSNPRAASLFVDKVADYVTQHPTVDYLHVWLADESNNSCECEACTAGGLRPADHYVALLNRIDERLTFMGSSVRIVLLLYVDLLWPPVQNRINNPNRFVLMFAPITRTFETSFSDCGPLQSVPAFHLNHLVFPNEVEINLSFLKEWQKAAPCDSFIYDYPLGRAHYGDPAYVHISKLIYRDLQANRSMGLNGINSCQEMRAAFPNALPDYVMARTSSDLTLTFEEIAAEYYEAAYGPDGCKLFPLMEQVSSCFSPDYMIGIGDRLSPTLAERLRQVPALLDQIAALQKNHTLVQYAPQMHMWQELDFFVSYTRLLAHITELLADGHAEEAKELFINEFEPMVQSHELIDQSGLDVYRSLLILDRTFKK